MLIRHCTYSVSIVYNPANNGTALSQAFSGIEADGVAYNLLSNPYLDDAASIQAFLTVQGLGTIYYTFDIATNTAQFITYNNQFIFTKFFLIQDKTGAPIPWEQTITQSDCQFLQDETVVRGCTDPDAKNYNSLATEDNGTCEYTPTTDADILRCKAVDAAYKVLQDVRAVKLSQEQYNDEMDCLWWMFKGVSIIDGHVYVGDVVIEEVEAGAPTTASATVNFGAVMNDTGYLTLTITINGVTVWSNAGDYIGNALGSYTTFQDFVDAVVAFINSDVTVPDYTATSVAQLVTFISVATGAAQNGYPVLFNGDEITVTGATVPTPAIFPTFGCYDPDRQEVWFGGQLSHVCIVFVGSLSTGSVDAGVNTGEVIYNRLLQRKYCGLTTTQDILRIDNANTIIPGNIPTGQTGTYYGAYNEFPATPQFAFTNSVPAITNSISVFRADTEAQMGYSPIILAASDDVLAITVNPQVGARQGFYYAALNGSAVPATWRVAVVDPLTGAVGYFTTTSSGPISVQFIENVNGAGAGVFELWCGMQSAVIERYDENGAFIANIALPANVTCRSIKQNGGYVFFTSDGGAIDVGVIRLSDLAIVCPSFECAVSGLYGAVVNTDTGDVYVGNPYAGDEGVTILSLSETAINFSAPLAGGSDGSQFTRPEVAQTESNNCTSDDDVNTMIQVLKDGVNGCCD